jgi:hypothetical protein
LLLTGIALLGTAIYQSFFGGSVWTAALGAFGTGLGLASFGANHDAAIAYAFQGREDSLPRSLKEELTEELDADRNSVLSLRPAPKVAMAIPWVAVGVQGWVFFRLFGSHL